MKVYGVKGVGKNCKTILFKTVEGARDYILPKLLEEAKKNGNINNSANIMFGLETVDYTFKSVIKKDIVKVETYEAGTNKKFATISRNIREVEVLE